MREAALLKEYIWLATIICKAGYDGISIAEINDNWLKTDMSEGVDPACLIQDITARPPYRVHHADQKR